MSMTPMGGQEVEDLCNAVAQTLAQHYSEEIGPTEAAQIAILVGLDLLRAVVQDDDEVLKKTIRLIQVNMQMPMQGKIVGVQ